MLTGDIVGSATSEARWVNHNVGTPDLTRNVHTILTFSPATVAGKTGTIYFMLNGATGGGNWVILGGSGELAGLHGQGTFTTNGLALNYEGEIHFDP